MAKVTGKLQVTVPKVIADRYAIRPGDHIEWTAAGDEIRVVPLKEPAPARTTADRLKLFDEATRRQRGGRRRRPGVARPGDRGWTRQGLYTRGRSR